MTKNMETTFDNIGRFLSNSFNIIMKIIGFYFIWILLHYVSSHLYIFFCVPNTLYGFLISPFLITTPQCRALRWCIYEGSNTINNMWNLLGNWVFSKIGGISGF